MTQSVDKNDDTKWCHKVIPNFGNTECWDKIKWMTHNDDTKGWHNVMKLSDETKRWQKATPQSDDTK